MPPPKGYVPFDPFTQDAKDIRMTGLALKRVTAKAKAIERAEKLAAHYQLGANGELLHEESSASLGKAARERREVTLTDFPEMPSAALDVLERLIATYGLPLDRLTSDTAAYVMRRAMHDYFLMAVLRRRGHQRPLFTTDELVELLRVLHLKPFELGEMLDPERKHVTGNLVHRWLHGVNQPRGLVAHRVNALIEQHVRDKRPRNVRDQGNVSSRKSRAKQRLAEWARMPELPLAKGSEDAAKELYWRAHKQGPEESPDGDGA